MEKRMSSSLFVNDGSFMERFKQLQQENDKDKGAAIHESKSAPTLSGNSTPKPVILKPGFESKAKDSRKMNPASSSGKLAFSLKQKSKLVAPAVKLGEDEDEDQKDVEKPSENGTIKRQKLSQIDTSEQILKHNDVVPPSPSDETVKKVADKLASFVAKNGRQFEHITRQKNPGDTPFKFLFDESCADYKYYEYQLSEEEKALSHTRDAQQRSQTGGTCSAAISSSGSQRSHPQNLNYQIPASALYESAENRGASMATGQTTTGKYGESSASSGADPISMMDFYMKKAAQEERMRQPKHSKDEMPPPASLQGSHRLDSMPASGKRGHHMGDFIPPEELEKFLASCNDISAQKAAKEAADRAKIQADNVGHRLLSKMGWKEGEGLGGSRKGIADPIMAGSVKSNNLGVGAHQPGEVTDDDDIYEQYKKRMMLGYRHRPNPMNNPRKAYY